MFMLAGAALSAALYITPPYVANPPLKSGVPAELICHHAPGTLDKPKSNKKSTKLYLGEYKITAYCPCRKCSEGYGNHTATGTRASPNHTIAVDRRVIQYGTKIVIDGMGEFTAEDCGGKVKGNHIDVYFEKHEETERFGMKCKKVWRRI